mmetsp:Transcript_29080/g.83350  ORF Transcript_29080/g.83350 Transcript_29080/m.83350 type:complete len:230 (-) Transcript_29080:692-1381(-)
MHAGTVQVCCGVNARSTAARGVQVAGEDVRCGPRPTSGGTSLPPLLQEELQGRLEGGDCIAGLLEARRLVATRPACRTLQVHLHVGHVGEPVLQCAAVNSQDEEREHVVASDLQNPSLPGPRSCTCALGHAVLQQGVRFVDAGNLLMGRDLVVHEGELLGAAADVHQAQAAALRPGNRVHELAHGGVGLDSLIQAALGLPEDALQVREDEGVERRVGVAAYVIVQLAVL